MELTYCRHINTNYYTYTKQFDQIVNYENKLLNKTQQIYKDNKIELDQEINNYDAFVKPLITNDSKNIIFDKIFSIRDSNKKLIESEIDYINQEKLKKMLDLKERRLMRNLERVNKNNLETTTNLLREFQIETYYQIKSLHRYPKLNDPNKENQFDNTQKYVIAFKSWCEENSITDNPNYFIKN